MSEFIHFLIAHWILSSAMLGVALLILFNELRLYYANRTALAPQAVINLMNHQQGIVVDLRVKEQFKSGHIMGALNILETELSQKNKGLHKNKHQPIILVCEHGSHSSKAVKELAASGFTQVFNLAGGLNAWRAESLPLIK